MGDIAHPLGAWRLEPLGIFRKPNGRIGSRQRHGDHLGVRIIWPGRERVLRGQFRRFVKVIEELPVSRHLPKAVEHDHVVGTHHHGLIAAPWADQIIVSRKLVLPRLAIFPIPKHRHGPGGFPLIGFEAI